MVAMGHESSPLDYTGMTEVTTNTTDHNDRPVAVGGIGNYVAARSVVSEFLLNKWEYRNTIYKATVAAGRGVRGGTIAPGRQRRGGAAPGDGANFLW